MFLDREMSDELRWIAWSFRWAVQALAQPAEVQQQLIPPSAAVADELALDFDNYWIAFRDHFGEMCTEKQRQAVESLNELLDAMSGPERPEIWLHDDCLNHPKWSQVRRLAENVLTAFDWPASVPPITRSIRDIPEDGN